MLEPREHLRHLAAYVLPERPAGQLADPLFLDSNENFRVPDPQIVSAAKNACESLYHYPDADAGELRRAIGQLHNLNPDQVISGRGAMELISLLVNAYLEPGCSAVTSEFGYLYFRNACQLVGAEVIAVPEPDLIVNTEAMAAAVTESTRIVFIVNPGNPSGSYISHTALHKLRQNLPEDVLLVVDEAYAEYVSPAAYQPCFELVESSNTVVLRTFSKVYGLAGMRIGWGYFPVDVAKIIHVLMQPNGVTGPAQSAALAGILNQSAVAEMAETTIAIREWFVRSLASLGFDPLPASGNFVLLRFDSENQAEKINRHLKSHEIFVRNLQPYNLSHCLRITIGTEPQMQRVIQTLRLIQ